MCIQVSLKCSCGRNQASFNLRDNILPAQVIVRLYCPQCSVNVSFDPETMVADNGWIVQFDMDVARHYLSHHLAIPPDDISPDFVFDEGWATWKGMYPGEEDERAKEFEKLKALIAEDPKKYFEAFKKWATDRMERFRKEGWRKASKV